MSAVEVPVLETARLTLRALDDGDLDAFAAMLGDAEVMRWLGDGKPFDRAGAWRKMALLNGHWQLRGYGMWAVVERATGLLVGRVGLWNPAGWPGLEVGWVIAREHWGRGFATEAAGASLAHAFDRVAAERVISVIHPANARSIRVAERIGEVWEREHDLAGIRVGIWGIARSTWQVRTAPSA